jgi:hypothetical protein
MFCPQLVYLLDLNARPCLNLYDERGGLVKTIPGLFSNGASGEALYNGINGTIRTGVALGQQAYSSSVESFDVQPYTY